MQENPQRLRDDQSAGEGSGPQWHAPVFTCFDAEDAEEHGFISSDSDSAPHS